MMQVATAMILQYGLQDEVSHPLAIILVVFVYLLRDGVGHGAHVNGYFPVNFSHLKQDQ
jgi:hypothetical protein